MKKVITILVLVAALQLAVVSATSAAPEAWGGGGNHHRVSYGETLYSIGRMYNADPQCIANANGLWNPDLIYAGQVLYIPVNCQGWGPHPYPPVPCGNYGCGGGYYGCGSGCTSTTITTCSTCGGGYYPQYPCGSNCGGYYPQPVPYTNYGYDYTGYYYSYERESYQSSSYSYTCGYYNNCW